MNDQSCFNGFAQTYLVGQQVALLVVQHDRSRDVRLVRVQVNPTR